MDKKYLIDVPIILIFIWSWYKVAFVLMECDCLWNTWGFLTSSVISLMVLITNLGLNHYFIKRKFKKFYLYCILSFVACLAVWIILIKMFIGVLS